MIYCTRCGEELSREHTVLPATHGDGPNEDGYFYLNGEKVLRYRLVEWRGDYYFINDYDKYAKNTHLYLGEQFVEGFPINPGTYQFDEQGRMILKNGPQADGFFYLNGIRQNCYQLIEWNGNYYFINDGHKYTVSKRVYLSQQFVEGTPLAPGYYNFDETGKLIMPEVVKDGPWEDGYFYLNGVQQLAYQLIKWNGNYYFVNDNNRYCRNNHLYLGQQFVEGSELTPGTYDFDAEGKLILKNGPQADGYFYINGVRQNCYQLINWNGDYYFINDGHKYAVNKRIYLSAGFIGDEPLAVGYYYFGADGKMVMD